MNIKAIYEAVQQGVVGRKKEIRLILAALTANRDLLLEGPPGTSKSTILRTITAVEEKPFYLVEGNADLTPAKIIGHHSPSRVLQEDYSADTFMAGPLPRAMQEGGFLYIEEFNRVPEDTLNTLITAMAEREVTIPRVGTIKAVPGFRVIGAMNPFDNIGTGRLSGALADRLCRLRMSYQTEAEELDIVSQRTGSEDMWLVRLAVRAVRRTREHADLRMGSSVRGAIDFVLIAEQIADLMGLDLSLATRKQAPLEALVDAAKTALAIKIVVRESSRRDDEEIVEEIVMAALAELAESDPDPNNGGNPSDQKQQKSGASPRSGGKTGQRRPRDRFSMQQSAFGTPNPDAITAKGELYYGDEAQKTAAGRPRGDRGSRTFARDYPQLAKQVFKKKKVNPADLEEALQGEKDDPLDILGQMASFFDRTDLRALARKLAIELMVRDARRNIGRRAGRGKLTSVIYNGDASELDLERTVESLIGNPRPADKDIFVWERRRRKRSYALMLDISGSMKGKKIFYAALALSAVAVRAQKDPFAVVAFWRDAAMLKQLREPADLETLLDKLLSLSGRGLTNLELGLRAGLDQLDSATTQERIGILFSDGLQTAGQSAAPIAAAYPTLHVVGTGESDESIACCQQLATLGHGRCAIVSQAGGIAQAINHCLAE
ncbi:MAG: AAA family ATPase [Ardenticatenaceae bacterium]